MFTKDEIQEIQRKLELSGKKLSQLPLVTEILEEDLLPILQKKENKSTTARSYSLFVQNQILPKIENLIEASTGEIKSSLLEVYKALLLNSEDNKNEIIEAINDLKAIVNKENKVTLTVTSDTQDAHIYLNGREQSSITVEQDSIVSLVIKAEGFVTFNEVICVHRTQKIHINLSTISGPTPSVYKITVNPTPSNASVKLDGEDCFYKYAEKGTYVDVEVTLAGYRPYKQSILINADKVLNVVLQPEKICKITFDYTSFKSYPIYIYNDDNDILFVSSSNDVIDKLTESKIDFDLFYPSKERRMEFIENQVKVRAPFDVIRNFDMNFTKDVNRIDSIESENVYKHKMLNKGEYIYNNNKILKYIENIISSGDKSKE